MHGVGTNKENIDPSRQAEAIEKIQTENATLHPGAKVAYVGWLTRSGVKKSASSLVVEFTTKEHADRAIREGMVLNAYHHDCELYDRSCKLKQCYKCQRYGHIGPQCSANETCGYCAESHNTRDCRRKEEEPDFTPKCVLCKGPHTTWSNSCQIRQTQLAKVEQARKNRPSYYLGPKDATCTPQTSNHQPATAQLASQGSRTPSTALTVIGQRKRPVDTMGGATGFPEGRPATRPRSTVRTTTRSTQHSTVFLNFTQGDGEVFNNTKKDLDRALEDRERELRFENQGSIWNGRTRRSATTQPNSQTATQQEDVDMSLIDPAILDSQPIILDE
ncbi:hypothetical protein ACJ73_04357 [Blastomyces percursus]|uniref:CCHC-type domain-containing protein n=1 Tax=Blastomyces percursus TaxID=1658174 RepID=A0A1J9R8G3_9EURO|nr:hypothetical protein ACJ73_04357 [Blastomyces percursus]